MGCGGATSQAALDEPIFIAVGAEGTILRSAEAATWTRESSGVTVILSSVAVGPAQFVAVGEQGTILTSPNGRVWTARNSRTDVDLKHVTFDGQQFVTVGGEWSDQATVLTSADGATWQRVEALSQYSFQAVATVRGTIFASAVTPSTALPMDLDHVVLASVLPSQSNRGGWILRDLPSFDDSVLVAAGDPETFLVGSWNGDSSLSRSRDGERWVTQALPLPDARAITVGPGGSTYVVMGGSRALSSVDGEQWTEHSLPVQSGSWLRAIAHGASNFAAVGSNGTIVTSPDAADWAVRSSGITVALLDVAFGPLGL